MNKTENEKKYPGSAATADNDGEYTPELERQYTHSLNNNPRNESNRI